jgi:hypothetical protein
MNKKILTLGLVLALALTFNCKKDSDDDDMPLLALLYIADQTSGNCATVTRGTPYTVQLSVVPKGGCSVPQTRAAAVETAKSAYGKYIAVFTKAGSACDSTTATYTKTRDELTVDNYIATKDKTEEQYKTDTVDKSRAVSVGSLIDEAKITLAAGGYDLTKVKLGTLDQLFVYYASLASAGGCQTAVKALDEALFTGLTAKTIVLSSSCSYGTGATDANRCATLKDAF